MLDKEVLEWFAKHRGYESAEYRDGKVFVVKDGVEIEIGYYMEYPINSAYITWHDAKLSMEKSGKCFCGWGLCSGHDHLPDYWFGDALYHGEYCSRKQTRDYNIRMFGFEAQQERDWMRLTEHWAHD